MSSSLRNLHECLQDASFEQMMLESSADYQREGKPKRTRPVAVQSFQIDLALKQTMDEICRSNGATASSFLRECARRLVSEYEGLEVGSPKWIFKYGKQEGIGDA
jgi:hypothetical protein